MGFVCAKRELTATYHFTKMFFYLFIFDVFIWLFTGALEGLNDKRRLRADDGSREFHSGELWEHFFMVVGTFNWSWSHTFQWNFHRVRNSLTHQKLSQQTKLWDNTLRFISLGDNLDLGRKVIRLKAANWSKWMKYFVIILEILLDTAFNSIAWLWNIFLW